MITLQNLEELNSKLKGRASICGGCFRSLIEGNEPKDVDIFLLLPSYADKVREVLKEFTNEEEIETTYSYEYGKYTVIKPFINSGRKLFGRPQDLIKEFDIDVTRLYMNKENKIESFNDMYKLEILGNIRHRECSITLFEGHEKRTTKRINKYIGYGYRVVEVQTDSIDFSVFYPTDNGIQLDTSLSGMCYSDL